MAEETIQFSGLGIYDNSAGGVGTGIACDQTGVAPTSISVTGASYVCSNSELGETEVDLFSQAADASNICGLLPLRNSFSEIDSNTPTLVRTQFLPSPFFFACVCVYVEAVEEWEGMLGGGRG